MIDLYPTAEVVHYSGHLDRLSPYPLPRWPPSHAARSARLPGPWPGSPSRPRTSQVPLAYRIRAAARDRCRRAADLAGCRVPRRGLPAVAAGLAASAASARRLNRAFMLCVQPVVPRHPDDAPCVRPACSPSEPLFSRRRWNVAFFGGVGRSQSCPTAQFRRTTSSASRPCPRP